MMIFKSLFYFFILFHAKHGLAAENNLAAQKVLTWDDCVRIAVEHNDSLKISERNLRSYEYQLSGASANFLPQLTGAVNYNQGATSTSNSTPTASAGESAADYSVALTVTQNLFNGFQDTAKVGQAKANLQGAQAGYQIAKAQLSYDLKSTVANVLYAQNYVALTQNIAQRRELNLRTVQLRFESGRENKGSLLLSKAYLEDARLDHLKARQGLSVAQSQLMKLLGEEDFEVFTLKGRVPIAEPPAEGALDLKTRVLEVPSYRQAIAQEDAAASSLELAQANFYPSLNLSAKVGDDGSTWYPQSRHWSLGASLTFPFFNGGRDYNAANSARESWKGSQFARADVLKNQIVNLKTAYASYVQAVQKLKVDEAYLEAATVREKVSRQKYNNGLATFDDWDIIENDLIKRQKELLNSERDRVTSEAAWEQALGKGVFP